MALTNSWQQPRFGTYSDLAGEYYDADRHPTSANFREASKMLLAAWLAEVIRPHAHILETGAGRSLVSECLTNGKGLSVVVVATDLSSDMLEYSLADHCRPASLAVCDAKRLPFLDDSFDLIASSLGDPYNSAEFWREAARVLRPGGQMIFTTPAFNWAQKFRNGAECAEFVLADGESIAVTSFVEPEEKQRKLITQSGLTVTSSREIDEGDLRTTHRSPKLRGGPIVSGYLVRKDDATNSA